MTNVQNFHIPEKATKRLALHRKGSDTRLSISSNMLQLFDFYPGAETVEEALPKGEGFQIRRVHDLFSLDVTQRVKKVYSRSYKTRRNNPIETLIQVTRSDLMECFKGLGVKAHVTFERGLITVRPIADFKTKALQRFKRSSSPLASLVCCTSGVDAAAMHRLGFSIEGIVEFRPQEPRDKQDLTETGIMTTLNNVPVKRVVNEDITELDLTHLMSDVLDSYASFHCYSPVCSSFSNALRKSLKEKAFEEGTSSLDMTFDILRSIEVQRPAAVLVENTPGYYTSDVYRMLSLRMRRWGYREFSGIYDARNYGGYTKRKRYYGFFTLLDGDFNVEAAPSPEVCLADLIREHLPSCRSVNHSKAIRDGEQMGLLRKATLDDLHCPTITRSQSRMAKDSLVIDVDGDLYFPSEDLLKRMQGMESFDLMAVGKSIGTEVIGQSVDGALHDRILEAVRRHLLKEAISVQSEVTSVAA